MDLRRAHRDETRRRGENNPNFFFSQRDPETCLLTCAGTNITNPFWLRPGEYVVRCTL